MTFMKTRKRSAPTGEKDGEYISWPRQHLLWIRGASAHLALCTKKIAICAFTFQWKTSSLLCVSEKGNGEQGTQRALMDMHVKLSVSNTFFSSLLLSLRRVFQPCGT